MEALRFDHVDPHPLCPNARRSRIGSQACEWCDRIRAALFVERRLWLRLVARYHQLVENWEPRGAATRAGAVSEIHRLRAQIKLTDADLRRALEENDA